MNELTTTWYQELIEDLKLIAYTHLIVGKWEMGKRINQDKGKLNRFEYGDKKVETITKDLGISTREIWRWMQFAEKCHDVTQLKEKPWRWIVNRYLPTYKVERSSIILDDARAIDYGFGEVVAELSTCFLASLYGLKADLRFTQNYIKSWSKGKHVALSIGSALERVKAIYSYIEKWELSKVKSA